MRRNCNFSLAGFLIYLKHHLPFIWHIIEWLNALLFKFLHARRVTRVTHEVISQHGLPGYVFRQVEKDDLPELARLLASQTAQRLAYFKPHAYDISTLRKVHANPSFLMMGAYHGAAMAGYFFLRCFWNKRCFVGRLIDEPYERKGIGRVMNNIMYNIAWESGFRCLSTISKYNTLVMRSHANNMAMKVLKELSHDYMLVEFVKPDKG